MDEIQDPKERGMQRLKDVFAATGIGAGLIVLLENFNARGLASKVGLPEKLASSGNFLACNCLNMAGGFLSGFTGRNYAGGAFYFIGSIPNLIDAYNGEDFSLNMQSLAIKTGVLFGGWALGRLTRKTYDYVKTIKASSR